MTDSLPTARRPAWRRMLQRLRLTPAHEREFLPAALEVLETPPSPAGRCTAWLIIAFFSLALLWACLGRIEMNAVASGEVIPIGGSKQIQPLEMGIVRELHVDDGQHVRRGDLLVVLDSVEEQVDLQQLQRLRAEARAQVAMLEAFLDSPDGALPNPLDLESSDPHTRKRVHLLRARQAAYLANLASFNARRTETQAAQAATESEIAKVRARCAVMQHKVDALRALLERNGVARLQFLEAQQELTEARKTLTIERERLRQHQANLDRLGAERRQYEAQSRADASTEWIEARDRLREAELNIQRYQQREQFRYLRAPVDGTVQQRAIHTIGGVVQPAQTLIVLVPDQAPLAVEAKVLNLDAGFVTVGQPVTLKLETFPYTKYGTLAGTVEHISRDVVHDEQVGPVYIARIALTGNRSHTGRSLPLFAGMAVSADIHTDERRLIEYLLSPIQRVASEALRER